MTAPFPFETPLLSVSYYIKPNQLSQRQHAVTGSRLEFFFDRTSWRFQAKHSVCDYSEEAIEVLQLRRAALWLRTDWI